MSKSFKPFKFNPLEELKLDIPKENRKEALQAAAEFIHESMLNYIGEGKSPVAGGHWKRSLSKGYKEIKSQESSANFANLELSGSLLDGLEVKVKRDELVIDVDKSDYDKAEGNILGSYGRDPDKNKARQFMPQGSETFKKTILSDLKELLKEFE